MAEITEGLKPLVKPYGDLATTSGGAYQEEFIDIYELTFYYTLLGAKAIGAMDVDSGDEDIDEMFNLIKAMMKPVSTMMSKAFKSIIDKGVFVGESKDSAEAAYETMKTKSAELFGA